MPGGVSSPVRAFKSVGGNPVVFDKVKGAYAWDVDGNKYIDYVGTWGPAILGHADDDVLNAVKATMDKGKCQIPLLHTSVITKNANRAFCANTFFRLTRNVFWSSLFA